jgi:hypothetical protein
MNALRLLGLLLSASVLFVTSEVQAGQVDLLIEKLVAKGILTDAEAGELKSEIESESAESRVAGQDLALVSAAPSKPAAPSLMDRITLKGDFRFRYQTEELDSAALTSLGVDERDRWRIRWRAGVAVDLTERWETGFGFASGGSNARSSNATLRRAFSRGDARLDYAYAKYTATDQVAMIAGKFKNPVWTPRDLLWDGDIRPEGVALPMQFEVSDRASVFVTPGYFILSEGVSGSGSGANMLVLQAGADFALSETVSLKLAPTYYNFSNLEGTPGPVGVDLPTNSRDADGNLSYDYDSLALGGQLSFTGLKLVPRVNVFGEWITAFDPSDDDTGWLLGFSFGDSKVSGFGDWQVKYNYRHLEADAWPEFLPDSDAFFGATGVKGSEIEFAWGVARGVSLSLDYYSGFKFLGTDLEQDLLQLDLNIKW